MSPIANVAPIDELDANRVPLCTRKHDFVDFVFVDSDVVDSDSVERLLPEEDDVVDCHRRADPNWTCAPSAV